MSSCFCKTIEVITEYLKIKVEMKFYSRRCLVILECKKEGTHFRSHSTTPHLLNCLLLWTEFKQRHSNRKARVTRYAIEWSQKNTCANLQKTCLFEEFLKESLNTIPVSFWFFGFLRLVTFMKKFLLKILSVYRIFTFWYEALYKL